MLSRKNSKFFWVRIATGKAIINNLQQRRSWIENDILSILMLVPEFPQTVIFNKLVNDITIHN